MSVCYKLRALHFVCCPVGHQYWPLAPHAPRVIWLQTKRLARFAPPNTMGQHQFHIRSDQLGRPSWPIISPLEPERGAYRYVLPEHLAWLLVTWPQTGMQRVSEIQISLVFGQRFYLMAVERARVHLTSLSSLSRLSRLSSRSDGLPRSQLSAASPVRLLLL